MAEFAASAIALPSCGAAVNAVTTAKTAKVVGDNVVAGMALGKDERSIWNPLLSECLTYH